MARLFFPVYYSDLEKNYTIRYGYVFYQMNRIPDEESDLKLIK